MGRRKFRLFSEKMKSVNSMIVPHQNYERSKVSIPQVEIYSFNLTQYVSEYTSFLHPKSTNKSSGENSYLRELGFKQSTSDPCIYASTGGEEFYIGVYVDDIVLAGSSEEKFQEIKTALSRKFDIKDMGKLHFF